MAFLYLTEFNAIGGGGNHPISGAQFPPVAEQLIAIGVVVQSAAFNKNTTFIRINVDAACSIAIGTNPTATVASARLAANQTEYFSCPPNSNFKVSVITNT